jgi:hypothetical protein
MYTASIDREPTAGTVDNERTLGLFGLIFGVLGGGAVFFFWTIGRVQLHTRNGGIINELGLEGLWLHLHNAYAFVMIGCFLLAGVLYWGLRRYKEAAGVAAIPVTGAVLYYLALVALR